jgi:hypothetical protein
MNKHAKNLQTLLALLPPEVCHVYRDTIHDAVIEIDRLDSEQYKVELIVNWLAEKARKQEKINSEYPDHVACYPSWVERVRFLDTLVAELRTQLKPTFATLNPPVIPQPQPGRSC